MIPDPDQTPHQSRQKCANCGLVNTGADELCRRCGSPLMGEDTIEQSPVQKTAEETNPPKRGFLKRVAWILGATSIILIIWYASLLISSDALQPDQREKVQPPPPPPPPPPPHPQAFLLTHPSVFRS